MSSPSSQLWLTLFGLLTCSTLAGAADRVEAELRVEAEPEDLSGVASRNPLPAWQAARAALPAGHKVRRLAFAPHGLNVFSTADGADAPVRASFYSYAGGRYVAAGSEDREAIGCRAATTVDAVDHALANLLVDPEWLRVAPQVGTLLLECLTADSLHWSVLLVPPGGYQAGVPIATRRFEFVAH